MGILKRLWPELFRDVVLNSMVASPLLPIPARWRALRACGMKVERCHVSPKVWFGSPRVSIGEGTFINRECMFNTTGEISIGANCDIAMRVTFVTASHEIGGASRRAGAPTVGPITVGDGAWIGAGAVVLPGVTIGAGAVIAAGSVVTSDCPAGGLYGGVPARLIRELGTDMNKARMPQLKMGDK